MTRGPSGAGKTRARAIVCESNGPQRGQAWSFRIKSCTPSANAFLRMHWAERRAMKQGWGAAVTCFAKKAGVTPGKTRRLVVVTRASTGTRPLDPQNAWTPIDKLIIDALVDGGWLVDDSKKWCDLKVKSIRARSNFMIVSIIEEIP